MLWGLWGRVERVQRQYRLSALISGGNNGGGNCWHCDRGWWLLAFGLGVLDRAVGWRLTRCISVVKFFAIRQWRCWGTEAFIFKFLTMRLRVFGLIRIWRGRRYLQYFSKRIKTVVDQVLIDAAKVAAGVFLLHAVVSIVGVHRLVWVMRWRFFGIFCVFVYRIRVAFG